MFCLFCLSEYADVTTKPQGSLSLPLFPFCQPTTMRVLRLLVAAVISCTALAAKKSPSAFDVYHKKSTPIVLNEQSYDELTAVPRDYHTVVVLTAIDAKYGCEICQKFAPEWDILAKSWYKGDKKGKHRLLFGTLDFDHGRNVFIKVHRDAT